MSILTTRALAAAVAAGVSLIAAPAVASDSAAYHYVSTGQGAFTRGTPNQGWWSPTYANYSSNVNYLAGQYDGDVYRDFFTFDLGQETRTATGAVLHVAAGELSRAPLRFDLYDVSTDPAVLNHHVGTSRAIYDDLGTGTSYGGRRVNRQASGELTVRLNADGVAALNAARGGYFSLGGRVRGDESSRYLFGRTQVNGAQRLKLEYAAG